MLQSPNFLKKNKRIVNYIFIRCLLLLIVSLFVTTHVYAGNSYAVFTLNPDLKPLTKSKVRMLFRGKIKSLQGKKIELSDWPQSNNVRNEFYQELLGKDLAQMNTYWARLSFSGKARPPKEIKTDSIKMLLDWLSEKNSRIGYAPVDLIPKNANVLYIVKKEKQ